MIRLLIFLPYFLSSVAFAEIGNYPRTFFSAGQNIFTGDDNESFAEGGSGYRISLTVMTQSKILVPYFTSSLNFMQSRQSFLDGSTEVSSNYNYYNGEGNIGLRLFPLYRERAGFNPFILGSGTLGYNVVQLNKSSTLTNIPHSDQSFSAGFTAGVGLEWIFENAGLYKTSFVMQFEYRSANATLFDRTFNLNHTALSIGIGW